MDGLAMLVISAVTPWLLERLKWAPYHWMRVMKPYSHWLNRLTPLVVAALVAAGVTVSFDEVSGTLTIRGLVPADMLRGVLLWAVGAVTQHLTYERAKVSIEKSV